MKKQELKEQLMEARANSQARDILIIQLMDNIQDLNEALERRRILYDRLANHSTIQKPKSMNEMAEALYDVCARPDTPSQPVKELSQEEQDEWMDRLLTILN
jgi:hypothetical protein